MPLHVCSPALHASARLFPFACLATSFSPLMSSHVCLCTPDSPLPPSQPLHLLCTLTLTVLASVLRHGRQGRHVPLLSICACASPCSCLASHSASCVSESGEHVWLQNDCSNDSTGRNRETCMAACKHVRAPDDGAVAVGWVSTCPNFLRCAASLCCCDWDPHAIKEVNIHLPHAVARDDGVREGAHEFHAKHVN